MTIAKIRVVIDPTSVPTVAAVAVAVVVVAAAAGSRTWIHHQTSTAVAAVEVAAQYSSCQTYSSPFAAVAVQLLQTDSLLAFVEWSLQRGLSTAVELASGSVDPRTSPLQQACSVVLQTNSMSAAAVVSGSLMRQTVHHQ